MTAMFTSIRPVLRLLERAFIDWQLRNLNPMAPQYGRLLMRRNEIKGAP